MLIRIFYSALLAFGVTNMAHAGGPFGIELNGTLEDYDCSPTGTKNFFLCKQIPRKHPDLDLYVIEFYDDVGVCSVRTATLGIATNPAGKEVREIFNRIFGQLQERYNSKVESHSASLSRDKKNFMDEMVQGLRMHVKRFYDFEEGEIYSIFVDMKALSRSQGQVVVNFFTQEEACKQKGKKLEQQEKKNEERRLQEGLESF